MRADHLEHVIDVVGAERLIELARPHVTDARALRIDTAARSRLASVSVAIEAPADYRNAAAIVRTAEALGCKAVHAIAAEGDALHAKETTQGAFYWIDTRHHPSFADFVASLDRSDLLLAGATMNGALDVRELPVSRPICVVFGNEHRGLSDEAITACDTTFRITMYGMSESLNLSVSAAITLYELTTRRRALLGSTGDLRGTALARERARGYARTVDPRLLDAMMRDASR